jgi:transcriptional regulator with XRE-family HTH domain
MADDIQSTSRSFARALRSLRKERGCTQETLADRSGLDRTFVSLLERGQRQPTLQTMARLAAALDLTLLAFVEEMSRADV